MSSSKFPTGLTTADALLLLTVLIWGTNFSVVKFGLSELSPLAFNAVRFACGGVAMAILARVAGQRWRFERRHLPFLISLGLLGNGIYQLLFIYGAAETTADNAALILGTVPAWVALGGSIAGLERVAPAGWLGIGLSFAGVTMIVLGADRSAEFQFGGASLHGDALILVGTLCWSAFTLLCKLAMRHYRALAVTSFCMVTGAVPLFLLGLPDLLRTGWGGVSPGGWASAIYSGIVAIGVATWFWNIGVAHLGSARTSLYSNLVPMVALFTAWLALGETLTAQQGVGVLAVLVGVVLARRFTRPR